MFNWLMREESGQGMVEYSLIFVVVVLIALVGLKSVGNKTLDLYNNISNNIS